MRIIKIFLLLLVTLLYVSCSDDHKSEFKSKFEHNGIKIKIDSLYYSSESMLDYQFELNYESNEISYKRYFKTKEEDPLLDEWIYFDSLNRLTGIHTVMINCSSISDDSLNIRGNLLSTLEFDDAYCLIAFNKKMVDVFKLDSKLKFDKTYKKKIWEGKNGLDVEIFTVKNNEKDSSLSSLSIFKSYKMINGKLNEVKVSQHHMFDEEKFNYMKTQYKYW